MWTISAKTIFERKKLWRIKKKLLLFSKNNKTNSNLLYFKISFVCFSHRLRLQPKWRMAITCTALPTSRSNLRVRTASWWNRLTATTTWSSCCRPPQSSLPSTNCTATICRRWFYRRTSDTSQNYSRLLLGKLSSIKIYKDEVL